MNYIKRAKGGHVRMFLCLIAFTLMVASGFTSITPSAHATVPEFQSTWNTALTGPSSTTSNRIRLPLTSSGTYNFVVMWGDGTSDTITSWSDSAATHTYATPGSYFVSITGTITGWRFNNSGDALKITGISQWGPLRLGSDAGGFFYGAANLTVTATDQLDLTGTTSLRSAFQSAYSFNADVSTWNVSSITDMQNAFAYTPSFVGSGLSGWNTSSATDMGGMFRGSGITTTTDISNWNVSHVTDFENMFVENTAITLPGSVKWYNSLLSGWASQISVSRAGTVLTVCGSASLVSGLCGSGAPQYSTGMPENARYDLIDLGMTVIDGGVSALNVPDQVTDVVTTPLSDEASITWPVPGDNGSPILRYNVTAVQRTDPTTVIACDPPVPAGTSPGVTCPFDPSDYLFQVTATNGIGTSAASAISAPTANPPIVQPAGSGALRVIVNPSNSGGTAQSYTVALTGDPSRTCALSPSISTCVFSGLTNGIPYQFSTTATNWVGSSPPSSPSNGVAPSADAFATSWNTTASGVSNSESIALPLHSGGNYNFVVYWGDGTSDHITSHSAPSVTHSYAVRGQQFLSITGTLEGWRFAGSGDRLKLSDISNWGSLRLGNDGDYFFGASNMTASAADTLDLTGTTILRNAFRNASSFNGNLSNVNVSQVTDFSGMFYGATDFNGNISTWNTSSATTMENLFRGSSFTGDVSSWDVRSVTNLSGMFQGISSMTPSAYVTWYNQLLTSWASLSIPTRSADSVAFTACGAEDSTIMCPNGLNYSGAPASAARQSLIDHGWRIVDGGVDPLALPGTPVSISAVAGDLSAIVTLVPAGTGGTVDTYIITSSPDSRQCAITMPVSPLSCTVTGLANGTAYTFTAIAQNVDGISSASVASNSVTPAEPVTPTPTPTAPVVPAAEEPTSSQTTSPPIPESLPGVTQAVVPSRPRIAGISVKFRKNNLSQALVTFTVGSDGGSPLLGAKVVCAMKGSKGRIQALGDVSPIALRNLKENRAYSCTLTTFNAIGRSPASGVETFKVSPPARGRRT